MPECLEPRQLFSTYTVNTISDATVTPAGTLTLRQAIADANASAGSDTINFSPTVFTAGSLHTITLAGGQLTLSDTSGVTTITGPGESVLAVSGNKKSRVFVINSGVTSTISGLTVTGGSPIARRGSDTDGAGIYNAGGLSLSSAIVTANVASTSGASALGGGIYSSGVLSLDNCTVSNNKANGNAIGGLAAGGGIYATGKLSLVDSFILGNSVAFPLPNSFGGKAEGGGIFSAYSAVLANDSVDSNTASSAASSATSGNGGAYGGGIFAEGNLTITASFVSSNTAAAGAMGGTNRNEVAIGGGIDTTGTSSIQTSTISGNQALGGAANANGGIGSWAYGGGIDSVGALTVFQSTISGNTVKGGAGSSPGGTPSSQRVDGGEGLGGGVCLENTYSPNILNLTDTTIVNNLAIGGTGAPAHLSGGKPVVGGYGGFAFGGGVEVDTYNATVTISDSTLTGNHAGAAAGGLGYQPTAGSAIPAGRAGWGISGGLETTYGGKTLINNSIISGNIAANIANDGRLYIEPASSNNLVGDLQTPSPLTNGVNGNIVGVTDPMLSPLGFHGGPTLTMMPLAGSPVLDMGKNSLIPAGVTSDQRGLPRIFGAAVDIGAVEFSKITISGSVFNDLAGNGVPVPNDPGLARWQVYIDIAHAGKYMAGDPATVTDSYGNYSLTFSPMTVAGPLMVGEVQQSSWRRTSPAASNVSGFIAVNPANGDVRGINFGNSATALVDGSVFHDNNANGRLDRGEKGLGGWTVDVDQLLGGVWHIDSFSTTTDANGNYAFVLIHGTYRIHDVITAGLHATSPAANGYTLTLGNGATQSGENFGNN